MADEQKQPRKDQDRHDPKAPKCNASYRFRGIERRCGKRGFHIKHGPGKG